MCPVHSAEYILMYVQVRPKGWPPSYWWLQSSVKREVFRLSARDCQPNSEM